MQDQININYQHVYNVAYNTLNQTLFQINQDFQQLFTWWYNNPTLKEKNIEWNNIQLKFESEELKQTNPQCNITQSNVELLTFPNFVGQIENSIMLMVDDFNNISTIDNDIRTPFLTMKKHLVQLVFNVPLVGTEIFKSLCSSAIDRVSQNSYYGRIVNIICLVACAVILLIGLINTLRVKIVKSKKIRKECIHELCTIPFEKSSLLFNKLEDQFGNVNINNRFNEESNQVNNMNNIKQDVHNNINSPHRQISASSTDQYSNHEIQQQSIPITADNSPNQQLIKFQDEISNENISKDMNENQITEIVNELMKNMKNNNMLPSLDQQNQIMENQIENQNYFSSKQLKSELNFEQKKEILLKFNVQILDKHDYERTHLSKNRRNFQFDTLKQHKKALVQSEKLASHQQNDSHNKQNNKEPENADDIDELEKQQIAQQRDDDVEIQLKKSSQIIPTQIYIRIIIGTFITVLIISPSFVISIVEMYIINEKVGQIIINELNQENMILISCFCSLYVSNTFYNAANPDLILHPQFVHSYIFNDNSYGTNSSEMRNIILKLNDVYSQYNSIFLYGSKQYGKTGDPLTDKIDCPRAQNQDTFINKIITDKTNCLIPSDELLDENMYEPEEYGETRCNNTDRIPGLQFPFDGLEFLQNKFQQSVLNLMNKNPSDLSYQDENFRYIIESTQNDLIFGQEQIANYLMNNLNSFYSLASNMLLGIFIGVFILISVVCYVIFKPIPTNLKEVSLYTEWMKQIVKSIPNRIQPHDEIKFDETLMMDVPRIDEAHRMIARTMSLIAQRMDELRIQFLQYFKDKKRYSPQLSCNFEKNIKSSRLNLLIGESQFSGKVELMQDILLLRILTHFADEENIMHKLSPKLLTEQSHKIDHCQILKQLIKFHHSIYKRFILAEKMIEQNQEDSINSNDTVQQRRRDKVKNLINYKELQNILPSSSDCVSFYKDLFQIHYIKYDRNVALFLLERLTKKDCELIQNLDDFSLPSSASLFVSKDFADEFEKEYLKQAIIRIRKTFDQIRFNSLHPPFNLFNNQLKINE